MFMLYDLRSGVEWAQERLAELPWEEGTCATAPCLLSIPPAFVPVGSDFGTPVYVIFNLGCQGSSFA